MKYKRLGTSGVKVSELCLGTMHFGSKVDENTAKQVVQRSLEKGINFIDTANVYVQGKSEEIVGRIIKGNRKDIVLATKVRHSMGPGPNDEGLSRKHIMQAAEDSLRRLDTDYIDIYYVHRPSNVDLRYGFQGEATPLRETLGALTDLIRAGKVLYIGCSNFPAWLHCKSLWESDKYELEKFVVSQPRYNLFQREIEREIIPLCVDQGIGIVPYSPLAGGVLSGKYKPGNQPPPGSRGAMEMGWIKSHGFHWEDSANLNVLQGLEKLSNDLGVSVAQIALSWFKANPAITAPIIAVSNVEQLDELLAVTEINLSQNDLDRINKIAPPMGAYYT